MYILYVHMYNICTYYMFICTYYMFTCTSQMLFEAFERVTVTSNGRFTRIPIFVEFTTFLSNLAPCTFGQLVLQWVCF